MAAVSLAMPTKLRDSAGRECGRTFLYLQEELFFKLSNLIGLLSWSFMLPPPNRFPPAAFSRRRSAALLQMSEQIVKHFSCADFFTLRFPHLPSQRGN